MNKWFATLDDHVSIQQIKHSWKHNQKNMDQNKILTTWATDFPNDRLKNHPINSLSETLKTLSFADLLPQKKQMKQSSFKWTVQKTKAKKLQRFFSTHKNCNHEKIF